MVERMELLGVPYILGASSARGGQFKERYSILELQKRIYPNVITVPIYYFHR